MGDGMKIEFKIIDLLARNTDKKLTINETAKAIGQYYSFVHRVVNKMAEEGVVKKERAGKAFLCSLNWGNEKTLAMLQLSEIEKRNDFLDKNKELKLIVEDFVNSLKTKFGLLSVVLFGSYAKGSAAKESDIDVLIISKLSFSGLGLEKITKEMYAKYEKEINPVVMTPDDFRKQKDKALIKEIINNHYVLYGVENFVGVVFK